MVRRVGLAGLAVVVLLSLGACQVLFIGVFPGAAGQVTAKADLSALVAPGPASYFDIAAVSAAGRDYVLLFSSAGFDPSQAHIVIMDDHLKVLASYSNNDLQSAFGTTLSDSNAMADTNGHLVIGNLFFSATSVPAPAGTAFVPLNGPSITLLPLYQFIEANFRTDGITLDNDEYNLDWSSTSTTFTTPLGVPSPPPVSLLQLIAIYSDPVYDSTPVTAAFGDSSSGYLYFVQIPKADVNVGPSLVFDPAYPQASRRDLEWKSVSASREGVVAYSHDSDSLIRFTVDKPGAVSAMSIGSGGNVRTSQAPDGSYCIVWDIDSRVLTRFEKWW